jgi:ribosomal protein L1
LVLGKLDQPDKELVANIETLIKLLGPGQIKKMVLKATMGPGVKVKI